MRQFQCVPTTYVTGKTKENYFEIYTYQVSCPLSLPLLNISNCHLVLKYLSLLSANCLCLHDGYISKFDFMNYLFANLVVAWLYSLLLIPRISRDWAKYVELSVVRGNQIMTYSHHFEAK